MKSQNSAGASCEDPGERTVTSLLRQLTAEAKQWQNDAQRHMLAGDINTALVFFQNALAKAQAAGESELEAELHNSVGCMLSKLGDKISAKAHYASAVAILERIYEPGPKEPDLLFFSRHNMQEAQRGIHADAVNKMLKEATHLLLEGAVHGARNILQEALPFAEHGAKDPLLEAELLNQLAWTHAKEPTKDKREENLITAVSLLKRAAALVEAHERHDETADKLARILDRNLDHFKEVLAECPVWVLQSQPTPNTANAPVDPKIAKLKAAFINNVAQLDKLREIRDELDELEVTVGDSPLKWNALQIHRLYPPDNGSQQTQVKAARHWTDPTRRFNTFRFRSPLSARATFGLSVAISDASEVCAAAFRSFVSRISFLIS